MYIQYFEKIFTLQNGTYLKKMSDWKNVLTVVPQLSADNVVQQFLYTGSMKVTHSAACLLRGV